MKEGLNFIIEILFEKCFWMVILCVRYTALADKQNDSITAAAKIRICGT